MTCAILSLVMIAAGQASPAPGTDLAPDPLPASQSPAAQGSDAPYPTEPPVAGKISVGTADVDGFATVKGAAGAVPAAAHVIVVNISAHTAQYAQANASGAFSAKLYAPPGSTILVKYETGSGDTIKRFWNDAVTAVANATVENINPLPGTMIYAHPAPAGDGQAQDFDTVGTWSSITEKAWAGWWLSGTLETPAGDPPGLDIQPGQTMTLTGELRVTSPGLNCSGTPTHFVNGSIRLRHVFDTAGLSEPWGIWFTSFLSTPTGLPIEHEGQGEIKLIKNHSPVSLTCASKDTYSGTYETTITVPANLPEGIYKPEIEFVSDTPLSVTEPQVEVWYHTGEYATLPLISVGDHGPPRIPWTLLGDELINGHRGLQAREDVGHYALPTRVLYPPHRVALPMLNGRTGEPLAYRLEPGSYWLTGTERRQAPPPHIPLDFPSGELVVEILKPDGSVDQLGPAPVKQSSLRTPTTPGGAPIAEGGGHMGDMYHLTTLEDEFAYSFDQYGPHRIFLAGFVNDIYGNEYLFDTSYDVQVARILDLDPAQLPTTPYEQGDAFAPGLHLFPPVPADVTVEIVHMPFSDPGLAVSKTFSGRANRFGYFQPPPGTEFRFELPGEFRVDISAEYVAPDGTLWAGYVTWGNVVEGPGALFAAHGRRGMAYHSDTIDDQPAWFYHLQLPPDKVDVDTYIPYFSGDVHWGNETPDSPDPGDSIHAILTIKDLTGPQETIYNIIRSHYPRARMKFRFPPDDVSMVGLEKRIDVDEAPLFITTKSGIDPAVDPGDIDLWGYWYGSSERPDVHVREIISEDGHGTGYWRFNDTYGYQIGEPAMGDEPGDLKWEFGGIVFRTAQVADPLNQYAIYSSLWVLLPHNDPDGSRITPPFQDATGASVNGGPILELLGEEIDMLFLPKGVRPGDILELGDVISFSGHVGPPLDSKVDVTFTSPTGNKIKRTYRANKIGWLYEPGFDFPADEPGRWTVDVQVTHDRPYIGNGVTPTRHNEGTVLGTSGRYSFYVVEPGSPRLTLITPPAGFLVWPQDKIEPVEIKGVAPPGTTQVFYTVHDKGVVMGQGSITPDSSGFFEFTYDPVALNKDFPMLSLTAREGRWEGLADEVTISFLTQGSDPLATAVTLIGEEVFSETGGLARLYMPVILRSQ